MHHGLTLLCLTLSVRLTAQVTNISCSDPAALAAMKGLHDPADYAASVVVDDHEEIICALRTALHADSLKAHLTALTAFGTRHTYSDTVSSTTGIGAARRWAYGRFAAFGAQHEGRLLPAYLTFDAVGSGLDCGAAYGWRNVLAVLPGRSTESHRIILIEAHLDSRCADPCDPLCSAQGAEDNGSGSALVIELARVLSAYTFDHTLVFMLTTAEEQSLLGAEAMATFCTEEGIAIKGVLNNDVVGGVVCGHSSSPPSCPGPADVDSLQVRLFSNGAPSQPHRGLARTIKLFYQEKLEDEVPVPMTISVMLQEDRTGRGGDHIPFRQRGFRNVRITAANEHGHGNPGAIGYDDRQHTSDDVLGVDTDGDLMVDSFFVDFNYLQRNATINGMTAALLAAGPEAPSCTVLDEPTGLRVVIDPQPGALAYRVGVHEADSYAEFDGLYRTESTSFVVPGLVANEGYYISVASIDADQITSPFSTQVYRSSDADTPPAMQDQLPYGLDCAPIGLMEHGRGSIVLRCVPNPSHGTLAFQVRGAERMRNAWIILFDASGREVHRLPVILHPEEREIVYRDRLAAGVYTCQLVVDGDRSAVVRAVVE